MITQQRYIEVGLIVASILCQYYDIPAIVWHKCHITLRYRFVLILKLLKLPGSTGQNDIVW